MGANSGLLLKQSTARVRMVNLGATSLTPTVTISKNGGAFAALGGSITEVSSNWYAVSLNTTDTNTLGDLAYHFSTGTDPQLCDQVSVDLPGNVQNIGGQAVALDGNNFLKVDVVDWAGTAVHAPNVAGYPLVDTGLWLGGTIPAVNVTGVPLVDAKYLLGTVFATPAAAGIMDVNAKNINNVATTSVTTVSAYVGTTQPANFTGTAGAALIKVDVTDIATVAVASGTAQLGVNVVNWAAQAVSVDANNLPKVDVHAIGASMTAATNLSNSAGVIYSGSVTGASPTTTTLVDSGLTQADTNFWNGRVVMFTSGTQKYQAVAITAFNHVTHTLTFNALTTAPVQNDTYIVV